MAGFNLGNVFYENHIFSYQYTSSFDFHKFVAHTFSYAAYLPIRHSLTFFGGYSKVHPELVGAVDVHCQQWVDNRLEDGY